MGKIDNAAAFEEYRRAGSGSTLDPPIHRQRREIHRQCLQTDLTPGATVRKGVVRE